MKLDTVDVLALVPEFMRNDEAVKAFATAVNHLIAKPSAKLKDARVWDQIDELSDEELDELAYELDIDWYNTSLPIENKRSIVKNSDLIHSRRGTKWAVEQLIESYFGTGFISEWFEEGYENPVPYHFTINTSNRNVTDELMKEFQAVAKVAMSVRSRLDRVNFSDSYVAPVVVAEFDSSHTFVAPKCGTQKCGM